VLQRQGFVAALVDRDRTLTGLFCDGDASAIRRFAGRPPVDLLVIPFALRRLRRWPVRHGAGTDRRGSGLTRDALLKEVTS
jgi:hypothetical protein